MKDLGPVETFLGIRLHMDHKGCHLGQEGYATKLLTKFRDHVKREYATPLPTDLTPPKNGDIGGLGWTQDSYRSAVGGLMWLMCGTRPDLSFAVGWLAQHVSSPTFFHFQMLSRVLGYVWKTKELGLYYVRHPEPLLKGYADADWATDYVTRRSISGYFFSLGGHVLSWCSRKQKSVALSSCEAEFTSFSEAVRECMWIRRLLCELLPSAVMQPTIIGQDNQAAIVVAESSTISQRSKHIQLKVMFSRKAVADRLVKPVYLPTLEMPADVLTKPLCRELFVKHRQALRLDVDPSINS